VNEIALEELDKNRNKSIKFCISKMKASNINDIQGLKFIFFLGIHLGYQDSKFSIPREIPVSHFWIRITGTIFYLVLPVPYITQYYTLSHPNKFP
jgi:hypothetical protein